MVASRTGGIPEYLVESRSGLLFTPGDADELAVKLRMLCVDPALCDRLAREARQVALDRFSPETRVPDLLDLYR